MTAEAAAASEEAIEQTAQMRFLLAIVAVVIAAAAVLLRAPAVKLWVATTLLGWDGLFEVAKQAAGQRLLGSPRRTLAREKYHELLDVLAEIDLEYLSPQRRVVSNEGVSEGIRFIFHALRTSMILQFESDPVRPTPVLVLQPFLKLLGDNQDAKHVFETISRRACPASVAP